MKIKSTLSAAIIGGFVSVCVLASGNVSADSAWSEGKAMSQWTPASIGCGWAQDEAIDRAKTLAWNNMDHEAFAPKYMCDWDVSPCQAQKNPSSIDGSLQYRATATAKVCTRNHTH